MTRAVLLLALVATSALAQPRHFRSDGRVGRGVAHAAQVLDIFPLGGAGITRAGSMCGVARGMGLLTGSYSCLNGDGTQDSSTGHTLTAVGSPTTIERKHA